MSTATSLKGVAAARGRGDVNAFQGHSLGDGEGGSGGSGQGGGLFVSQGSLTMVATRVVSDFARGGAGCFAGAWWGWGFSHHGPQGVPGGNGGTAQGGGLYLGDGTATMTSVTITKATAAGGVAAR